MTSFFGCYIVLLGFISPFYFGVIKIKPTSEGIRIKSEALDKIYEEKFPTEDLASPEAARRYFVEGKRNAAEGNRPGFIKSIDFYKKAIELVPSFSSAYAEIAYSYVSIAKVLEKAGAEKQIIEENLKNAEEAIGHAKRINSENPTVFAVDLLTQYTKSQYYLLHKREHGLSHDQVHEMEYKIGWIKGDELNKLRDLARRIGFTDKVYLAEALLTEDRIVRGSSLLTIIEKLDPDNAEVHNLLGVVYYLVNDRDSAKRMFERAKRLSPDFGKPYLNLALVYPKNEIPRLYKEALNRDEDLMPLADYYLNIFQWIKQLQTAYIIYLIMFVPLVASLLASRDIIHKYGKKSKLYLCFTITLLFGFIIAYGSFEIYIHLVKPINGIDYMFPVSFPFF
jgi:tetratricopeptide (TPR) repeat protein